MHAQHQNSGFRKFLQDLPCRFDAAQFRHRAVHHRHPGPQFAGQTHGFISVAGFSNNRNILVVLQHAAKSAAHQRMIICEQNRDLRRHWHPLSSLESEDGPLSRPGAAERWPACRQSIRRVLAWPPTRSRAAFFPPRIPSHDLPLRVPANPERISAGSRHHSPRNAGSRCSALPAARDKYARLRSSPLGMAVPSFRNAAQVLFAAPPWEYTSPECSLIPPLRVEPDEAPARVSGYCSVSIAQSLAPPSNPRAEAILPGRVFLRGPASSRSPSRPVRIHRAVRGRYAAELILASKSISAPNRCAVRKVQRVAQKSPDYCESDTSSSRQSQ